MLIDYIFAAQVKLNAPAATVPDTQKVRIYIANPDPMTYGSGKYMGLMMQYARGLNVATASAKSTRRVALEQALA